MLDRLLELACKYFRPLYNLQLELFMCGSLTSVGESSLQTLLQLTVKFEFILLYLAFGKKRLLKTKYILLIMHYAQLNTILHSGTLKRQRLMKTKYILVIWHFAQLNNYHHFRTWQNFVHFAFERQRLIETKYILVTWHLFTRN